MGVAEILIPLLVMDAPLEEPFMLFSLDFWNCKKTSHDITMSVDHKIVIHFLILKTLQSSKTYFPLEQLYAPICHFTAWITNYTSVVNKIERIYLKNQPQWRYEQRRDVMSHEYLRFMMLDVVLFFEKTQLEFSQSENCIKIVKGRLTASLLNRSFPSRF